ncbi:ribosome biogenesis GTPase YlqF [Gemmiger sp. An194]|uniref:ribosome biogenesis GTPase YlqF n=1 Tax=Gemmiger sp. An194 TaxID=1965582 RepID=UPI000B37F284|nr:ribosome biogenesis GTPase YlqF [Gemmiger sp. An194]OUP25054.1 ribosome biogenesis GTPase YlqF [Gemmiger sp. An194]
MSNDMINRRNIQWFPGHMMKTLRLMEANIKNVDAVLQLLDARIPMSSLNPEIQRITEQKPRLYVMNKADLADPTLTNAWVKYFRASGAGCVAISAKQKGSAAQVRTAIEKELEDLIARRAIKGMGGARIRVMVVGIPNVGKSTFINNFAGQVRAKAADRPGVTRGKQWVTVGNYDLLDMPGVLWKKFDSLETATNLAFIGSIKDDILDIEELAMGLLSQMQKIYPEKLAECYKLSEEQLQLGPWELLEAIGRKRGMLISGGEVNTERAAIMLVDEFRASKWSRITLEKPYQMEQAQEQEVQE